MQAEASSSGFEYHSLPLSPGSGWEVDEPARNYVPAEQVRILDNPPRNKEADWDHHLLTGGEPLCRVQGVRCTGWNYRRDRFRKVVSASAV